MIDNKNITGIILAGGNSNRMGQDKGLVLFQGKPFIAHIINVLAPVTNNIIIVSNHKKHDVFQLKRITDMITDAGPLAGLYTGLHHSKTENNIVLSCDIPLINTVILKKLIAGINENADVIQLKSEGKTMPLIALYKKRCENVFYELLQKGERRVRIAIKQLKVKTIVLDAAFQHYATNINTPDQLKKITHDNNR